MESQDKQDNDLPIRSVASSSVPPSTAAITERLCANCGMCCNGVLFHSVTLQAGDFPRTLTAHGLRIKRKAGRQFFLQPCPAHAESRCRIYTDRPTRCRDFQCRQLQGVIAGRVTEEAAIARIRATVELAAHVDSLINQVAETNPARALAQRAANALTTDAPSPLHDELAAATTRLEAELSFHFRPEHG